MADKISGYGRMGLDVGSTRSRAVAQPEKQADTDATRRSAKAGRAGDAVELTSTAARLKSIETRLADVPDVDQARVEAMRKRIESGDYQPDAARVAQKLIRMEQELA